MGTTELHNVKPPVSGRVCAMSVGGADVNPGEGLIEFVVPRHIVERCRLGETWILSRVITTEETQQREECDDHAIGIGGVLLHCARPLGHRGPHSKDAVVGPLSTTWRHAEETP